MRAAKQYWFPAKRYGWGWGLPIAWQGWAAVAIFAVLLVVGAAIIAPRYSPTAYVAYVAILGLCLAAVCWLKGEPPRWRWGDDDRV